MSMFQSIVFVSREDGNDTASVNASLAIGVCMLPQVESRRGMEEVPMAKSSTRHDVSSRGGRGTRLDGFLTRSENDVVRSNV